MIFGCAKSFVRQARLLKCLLPEAKILLPSSLSIGTRYFYPVFCGWGKQAERHRRNRRTNTTYRSIPTLAHLVLQDMFPRSLSLVLVCSARHTVKGDETSQVR